MLLLSPQLMHICDVVSRGEFSEPVRVHLEASRGRLYVAGDGTRKVGKVAGFSI